MPGVYFYLCNIKSEARRTDEELEELVDSFPLVYAAISSNTAITRRPPKSNLMGTERPDSITRVGQGGRLRGASAGSYRVK